MKLQKQKRLIEQNNIKVECYYYGAFKSPGLKKYPDLVWVNKDYEIIKQSQIARAEVIRLAKNLFIVGKKYHLFDNIDYLIMMPKKETSVSSLDVVIKELVNLIKGEFDCKVEFLDNIFQVDEYRKFWENRLKVQQRKNEIANKVHLLAAYNNIFTKKNIIIIDDVVASGVSIAQVAKQISNNNKCFIKALCYGSVYKWEAIYN